MADCNICKYRQFLANAYDMHIDHTDCDKVNTFFCEKMQKPDTAVIIDAGCTDKTFYHKGFKDGYESVNVVHGQWLFDSGSARYFCSACSENALMTSKDIPEYDYDLEENLRYSHTETIYEEHLTNYCPNCGAKMNIEKE